MKSFCRRGKPQVCFAICIKNRDYPASLELRKIYRVVPDQAAAHKQILIIDESGEDYLYPAEYFVSIRLPQAVGKAVLQAS
jgi:hypothetical protein